MHTSTTEQRALGIAGGGALRSLITLCLTAWLVTMVPPVILQSAHIGFADERTARWLIPTLNLFTLVTVVLCRRRERRARESFSSLPGSVKPVWWERALVRWGKIKSVKKGVAVVQATLLIVASTGIAAIVAKPVHGLRPHHVRFNSLRVVPVIDVSYSEDAEDCDRVPPDPNEPYGPHNSRIQVTTGSLEQLQHETTGNGMALNIYASEALMLQPRFVYDQANLWYEIKTLRTGSVNGGTRSDIARGLEVALDFIEADKKKNPQQSYMIILFSDGGFSAEAKYGPKEARLAQQLARWRKLAVAPVVASVGSDSPVTIPQYQRNQQHYLVKVGDLKIGGRTVTTFRNQKLLDQIASELPGCQSFHLRTPGDLHINWGNSIGDDRVETDAAPVSQLLATVVAVALALRAVLR